MPRHTQEFVFRLNDKVKVIEIDRPGVINGMSVDALGVQYRVVYWNDCTRRSEWVYADEIRLLEEVGGAS